MKVIKYQFRTLVDIDESATDAIYNDKTIPYSEANEAIAKSEAYNGEYTIEDIPDEPAEPTQLDRIEAQTMFTALMTDTLLEV